MIWGVLGIAAAVALVVATGVDVYQVISSGEYKNWSLYDWIVNIGLAALSFFPFLSSFGALSKFGALLGGALWRFGSRIPVIRDILANMSVVQLYRAKGAAAAASSVWGKGKFMDKFGRGLKMFKDFFVKHPWLSMGLVLLSAQSDGLFSHLFQMWGDISLRAAEVAFDKVSEMMSDKGYGNPVSEAVAIIDGSKGSLPECFTAIWGAVGASECIGLIITTFQYLFLLSSITMGFKLYGGNKK